jgi:hypothetical protein
MSRSIFRRPLWLAGTVLGGAALVASMAVLPAGASPTTTAGSSDSTEVPTNPASAPSLGTPLTAAQLGATVAPAAPAGTDLAQLSDAQLKLYHLPPRPPSTTPAYATWLQAMNASQHALTPLFSQGRPNPDLLQQSAGAQPDSLGGDSGDYNENWAGNIDTQYGNYTSVSGDWVEPNVYTGSGSRYSCRWLGLGGVGAGTNLYQIGTEADTYYSGGNDYVHWYTWMEDIPNHESQVDLNLNFTNGQEMYADVYDSGGNVTFYLVNETTQTYLNPITLPEPEAQLGTAEAIMERTEVNGGFPNMTFTSVTNFSGVDVSTANGIYDTLGEPYHLAAYLTQNGGPADTLWAYPSAWTDPGIYSSFPVTRTTSG